MGSINNKEFNKTMENLNNLMDGTRLHLNDEGFPSNINEASLQTYVTALMNALQAYEETENTARIKFDLYSDLMKSITKKISNYGTQIYGLYGKKNQVVADFGLAPHKTGKAKRAPVPQL